MADKKISDLNPAAAALATQLIEAYDPALAAGSRTISLTLQRLVDLINLIYSPFLVVSTQSLKDSGGFTTVDWGTGPGSKKLYDGLGVQSVLWDQRALVESTGVSASLNWGTLELSGAWTLNGSPLGAANASGAGSPIGVVVPTYVGQDYTDTTPPYGKYTAVGLTNADWVQIY